MTRDRIMRMAGIALAVLQCGVITGLAQDAAAPPASPASGTPVMLDAVSVPTPGELFAALEKNGRPAWSGQFRDPVPTTYASRAQRALNIGGLIADGYIAVEAQDSQQVKNIGHDIMSLAKPLGVSKSLEARGSSITDFADNNEWSTLKEELDATQNEVKLAMQAQKDEDLVILVTLGAWIRGTQVVSGVILKSFNPDSARLLRQPALVGFLRAKINGLPPKLQEDPVVAIIRNRLEKIEALTSFARGATPSEEQVRELNAIATELVTEISKRPN